MLNRKTSFKGNVLAIALSLSSISALSFTSVSVSAQAQLAGYSNTVANVNPTGNLTLITKDYLQTQHPEEFANYPNARFILAQNRDYNLPTGKHVIEWWVLDDNDNQITTPIKQVVYIKPIVSFSVAGELAASGVSHSIERPRRPSAVQSSAAKSEDETYAVAQSSFAPIFSTENLNPDNDINITYQLSGNALTSEFIDFLEQLFDDDYGQFERDTNQLTMMIYPDDLMYALEDHSIRFDKRSFRSLNKPQSNDKSAKAGNSSEELFDFKGPFNWNSGDTLKFKIVAIDNGIVGTNDELVLTVTDDNVLPMVTEFYAGQRGCIDNITDSLESNSENKQAKAAAVNQCGPGVIKDIVFNKQSTDPVQVVIEGFDPNGDLIDVSWDIDGVTFDINGGNAPYGFGSEISFIPANMPGNVVDVSARLVDRRNTGSVTKEVSLRLVLTESNTSPILDGNVDSDNDGISDSDEGVDDTDGDGIPDYLDNSSDRSSLPVLNGQQPIRTQPGIALSLGVTNGLANGQQASGAAITLTDLANFGNNGSPANNADNSATQILKSDIVEFTAAGLANPGDSIQVVIPLTNDRTIPANATYQKYFAATGWKNFVIDARNQIHSAMTVNDVCPSYDDVNWQAGLNTGHNCIRLTIEDGGPNDTDGVQNNAVTDPGALFVPANTAPVANAKSLLSNYGQNQWGKVDGTLSTDVDGNVLTYTWTQIDGPKLVVLKQGESFTFVTPYVSTKSKVRVQLTVNDGFVDSAPFVVEFYIDPKTASGNGEAPNVTTTTEVSGGGGSLTLFGLFSLALVGLRRKLITKA